MPHNGDSIRRRGVVCSRLLNAGARRFLRTLGLIALFVVAAVLWSDPPVAQAYDHEYYRWCVQAVGEEAYCCNKAGGVWTGSGCAETPPSPTPPYIPPR